MNPVTPHHVWVFGGTQRDRWLRARELAADRPTLRIDAHRRLRGPYTGVGTLLRALDREVLATGPMLLGGYRIAILSAAPELASFLGASEDTLTALASPAERTRLYSSVRTLRISHAIVELLSWYFERLEDRRPVVVLDNVDHADA